MNSERPSGSLGVRMGKRRMRRQRARARQLHRVGGSGAATPRPLERLNQWRRSRQLTH